MLNPRKWPKLAKRAALTGVLTVILAMTGIALPEPAKQAIVEAVIQVDEQLQEKAEQQQDAEQIQHE